MLAAEFPDKLQFLFEPRRYKIMYGGRGGSKSWGAARALLIMAAQKPLRVLCARETQKSIADSVHKLLSDQIYEMGLESYFTILKSEIKGKNGSQFIFAGIRQNVGNIKSYEACDVCWVEEAQTVSKSSWSVLIPTIRKEGSEIWVTFNPDLDSDDTYQRFVVNPPPNAAVVKLNWSDNPWFPETLRIEKDHLKAKSPDDYEHIYEGHCKQVVDGAIYRNELLAADKESRLTRVPYDATKPVHTFWDLGIADNTSIWFAQSVGFEFRVIDYMDGSGQGLQFYLRELQQKPYVYGIDHLPHDAQARELGSGRSIEEQMRASGRKVKIVRKLSVQDGIAAARAIFSKCWFDREKCADGLQALRHYRYEQDEKLRTFKKDPLHDWASHAADAFRYLAVEIQEVGRPRQQEEKRPQWGADMGQSWMGG